MSKEKKIKKREETTKKLFFALKDLQKEGGRGKSGSVPTTVTQEGKSEGGTAGTRVEEDIKTTEDKTGGNKERGESKNSSSRCTHARKIYIHIYIYREQSKKFTRGWGVREHGKKRSSREYADGETHRRPPSTRTLTRTSEREVER